MKEFIPRLPELRKNNNVDTRIWHNMLDEGCTSYAELNASLRQYRFGKAHWGKACQKRLDELVELEANRPLWVWDGEQWKEQENGG